MHVIRTALMFLVLACGLSACNTTDALTPQVDIPNGTTTQSTPVTQSDAQQLADNQQPAGDAQQFGNTGAAENRTARAGFGAQTTLQAQADALSRGNQQTIEEPVAENRRIAVAAVDPTAGGKTVRFLPIIGAPVQAVTPLSRQLGAEARANGLTIKSSSDTSSDHILKGYFSAFGDGAQVTVVYVWDVLDNAGGRLHRIQGQETVPGSGDEPWASVPADTMQSIARKTIAEYSRWLGSRAG